MRLMVISALALATALLLLQTSTADAQPETTFIYPEDGAVFGAPPPIMRLCFATPVNIQDLDKGGDFRFSVITPQGRALGLRIVFQSDGLGVDIHRGIPTEPVEGEWTFEWRVTDPGTLEPAEGRLSFTVTPIGSPAPEEPPGNCAEAATATPEISSSPTADAVEDGGDDNDGGTDTDVLIIAIVGAVVGVAALGSVLFYFIRRRSQ